MSALIRSARDNPRLKQLKQQRDAGTLSPTDYQAACTLVFRGLERGGRARRLVDALTSSILYDCDRRVYPTLLYRLRSMRPNRSIIQRCAAPLSRVVVLQMSVGVVLQMRYTQAPPKH